MHLNWETEYRDMRRRIAIARQRIEDGDKSGQPYAEVGAWYAFRGEFSFALQLLDDAKQAGYPVDPRLLVLCRVKCGDRSGAIRALKSMGNAEAGASVGISPQEIEAQEIVADDPAFWGHLTEAMSLFYSGEDNQLTGVRMHFERALHFQPNQARLIAESEAECLARLASDMAIAETKLSEALEFAQKAVQLQADSSNTRSALGWVYYKTGQLEKAVEELKRAFELSGDGDARVKILGDRYGDVLWRLGKRQEAVQIWRETLRRMIHFGVLDYERMQQKLAAAEAGREPGVASVATEEGHPPEKDSKP